MRLHVNRLRLSACAAVFLIAAMGAPSDAQLRPTSYAQFDASIASGDAAALKAAVTGGERNYIYLQRGYYVLDNPVIIDRSEPLFIHGADRMSVMLVAKNPAQPLFLVRNAPLLNFAGMRFRLDWNDTNTLGARAVTTVNTQQVSLEFQDCALDHSALEFGGPGSYRIQSCYFAPGGRLRTPILIDHPGADVLIFGGDGSNSSDPLRVGEYAHVWQKRGRVRIYATTFEGGLGPADVRIESASTLGPHVIANVRSEGVNGALNQTGAVSRLLYVPPTSERVDVVVKSSGGAWLTGPETNRDTRVNCKLVSYNGAGTMWLFGNRADYCGRHLVEGNAPLATIVSVGNMIASPEPFTARAAKIITAADAYNHMNWTGQSTLPVTRWIPDGSKPPKLASYANVPQPPEDLLPPALERPDLPAALPGMIDVKRAFGAKGDGSTDDTPAIQRALDANCDRDTPKLLYFPAGTYRIRHTLYLNHHAGGNCRGGIPGGGWIAGAGSASTVIAMAPGVKEGVFTSDSLAFATVQGITFKAWTWREGDPQEPNFDLEGYPGYIATQLNNFYDVVFDGGYAAFAAGVRPPGSGNCSSNAVFGGRMKNAHIGFVSGHFNAAANVVYDSELIDNDIALGLWTTDQSKLPAGGTYYAYRSSSRGTRDRDFLTAGIATGSTFYFYEWTSDAPNYLYTNNTGASWPVMLERARLTPRAGATYLFDVGSAQGPFFLYSWLSRSGIRVGRSHLGQSYAVNMHSEIADWPTSVATDPDGQLEEIWWTSPAALGVPGTPQVLP